MEKVIVSKEVAEAIEILRSGGETNANIVKVSADPDDYWLDERCGALNNLPLDDVVKALYIGYETEESSEVRVKELYESYGGSPSAMERKGGIVETLNLLGIKIEGVNA